MPTQPMITLDPFWFQVKSIQFIPSVLISIFTDRELPFPSTLHHIILATVRISHDNLAFHIYQNAD